jgi:hypothetical protein
MTTFELLQKQQPQLASLFDAADEPQLRRLASAVTRAAVKGSGLVHPVITEALHQLDNSPPPHSEMQARVESLAEQLDEEYFVAQEAFEEREGAAKADPTVIAAFARARAASAVVAALGDDAHAAAAEAAYEAIFATDDHEYVIQAAKTALKGL